MVTVTADTMPVSTPEPVATACAGGDVSTGGDAGAGDGDGYYRDGADTAEMETAAATRLEVSVGIAGGGGITARPGRCVCIHNYGARGLERKIKLLN